MGVHVVASGDHDAVATWVTAGLSRLLGAEVLHITTADLAGAPRWTQHIGASGVATSDLHLPGRRALISTDVDVVYNRIVLPPRPPLDRVVVGDRDYATAELHACTLSWLASLGARMLNAPHPAALGGDPRGPLEWAVLALRAGLPALLPGRGGDPAARPRQHTLVIGDAVIGPPAAHRLADGLFTLRRRSGLDVLGLDLAEHRGRWSVAAVTALPDLRRGGRRALEALATLFRADEADRISA